MKYNKIKKLGTFFLVLSALCGVAIPFLVKAVIDGNSNYFPYINNYLLLGTAFFLQVLFSSLGNFRFVTAAENYIYELRKTILQKILDTDYTFFDENNVEKLPSHLTKNIEIHQEYVSKSIPVFVQGILTIITSFVSLFILDWKLTGLLLLLLPLVNVIIIPFSKLLGKFSEGAQKSTALFIEKIINSFSNMMYVKALNAKEEIAEDLDKENKAIRQHMIHMTKLNVFMPSFLMFFLLSIIALLFVYGSHRVQTGEITLGVLISFLLYIFQLLTPISSLNNFLSSKEKDKRNQEVLDQYLSLSSEEKNETAQPLEDVKTIEFKEIDFAYNEKNVLKKLSLSIQQGEKIAVVGPSGSGKSTLYKLLLHFYERQAGDLLINGESIERYTKASIREKIVFIPQENSIIGSNLYEFMALGYGTLDKDKVLELLEKVGLKEELGLTQENIEGFDFGIGASRLSTGQKQRLMVAKAMLSDGEVYLLDEATASIDSELETKIFETLSDYKKEKTILSIAHRLSTVKYVDRIIFIEDGQVTGDASHKVLYETHEKYRNFVDLQMIE